MFLVQRGKNGLCGKNSGDISTWCGVQIPPPVFRLRAHPTRLSWWINGSFCWRVEIKEQTEEAKAEKETVPEPFER